MKFDDLNEELTDSDVHLTVDNEGFAELTEVYNKLDANDSENRDEDEVATGIALNAIGLKDQLLLLTKIHEQSNIPLDAVLPDDLSHKILDLVENFQGIEIPEHIDQDVRVSTVSELVENSDYLKEKRDDARKYVSSVTGKLHPNTKNHIDAYLKKHTGNCSDNFVTVTRIGPTPITPVQKKINDEAELQYQKADAIKQIAQISKFLLQQVEDGKIAFAPPPAPPVLPPPTIKEKVLGKLGGLKFKFKQVKKELFYSAVSRVQKILNVQ
jgi:hypothetical protein